LLASVLVAEQTDLIVWIKYSCQSEIIPMNLKHKTRNVRMLIFKFLLQICTCVAKSASYLLDCYIGINYTGWAKKLHHSIFHCNNFLSTLFKKIWHIYTIANLQLDDVLLGHLTRFV